MVLALNFTSSLLRNCAPSWFQLLTKKKLTTYEQGDILNITRKKTAAN